jgi:hypothetical protein
MRLTSCRAGMPVDSSGIMDNSNHLPAGPALKQGLPVDKYTRYSLSGIIFLLTEVFCDEDNSRGPVDSIICRVSEAISPVRKSENMLGHNIIPGS